MVIGVPEHNEFAVNPDEGSGDDPWTDFLRGAFTMVPAWVPRRAWVLAGVAGFWSSADRRGLAALAIAATRDGESTSYLVTVPLIRHSGLLNFLKGYFIQPVDSSWATSGANESADWPPWAAYLTPTLFTLPHLLEVRFDGRPDEETLISLNSLVRVAHALAEAARFAGGTRSSSACLTAAALYTRELKPARGYGTD